MDVCDLSGPDPSDPIEALALDAALTDAHRGCDIRGLAPTSWAVCKLCGHMAEDAGVRSRCCRAPLRIQGWALPAAVVPSSSASVRR